MTGKASSYRKDLDEHLARLRDLASIPVLTGFGISTHEDVERFNHVSDGVIVGSKIVQALADKKDTEIANFIRESLG